jgi:hypothetical protein
MKKQNFELKDERIQTAFKELKITHSERLKQRLNLSL